MTQYAQAILAVGEIISCYDADQLFPVSFFLLFFSFSFPLFLSYFLIFSSSFLFSHFFRNVFLFFIFFFDFFHFIHFFLIASYFLFSFSFQVYGFGAKLPDGNVSHCFPLNGNPQNPYFFLFHSFLQQ